MNVKQLFADEDAVSPVIGVILMVAITVILAAVIGTFVLGLGENVQDSAPQANFQFEYTNTSDQATNSSNEEVDITHTGGEDIDLSTVSVKIGSANVFNNSAIVNDQDGTASTDELIARTSWSDPVSTGDTQNIREANSDVFAPGDDVRIIWTSTSGGSSNTIGQSTVPS